MQGCRWKLWYFFSLLVACEAAVTPPDPVNGKGGDDPYQTNRKKKKSNDVLSLADSIERLQRSFQDPQMMEIRRQYWQKTFNEIRNLTGGVPKEEDESTRPRSLGFLGQWKLLSRNVDVDGGQVSGTTQNATTDAPARKRTPRFEGFATWDRLVQDWADDVQEYLDNVQAESEVGYSFGNFGRPAAANSTAFVEDSVETVDLEETSDLDKSRSRANATTNVSSVAPEINGAPLAETVQLQKREAVKQEKISIVEPAPRQANEPVLPHTDISDKSKRILVVTTASLPWRTGTAVNPLLRAAYLTKGRKQAGGSVTLMLPWLERSLDQERVYGDSAFESREAQEESIRTWLRDSANMPQASKDLIIRWYTAWQNPVENSIYSMGDITALIPSESVDICILEEPEHLNWYRAPGESWTLKFKHVVGILHTNYFSYALDQPGAFIRAPGMRLLCSWMCRAHCHRLIKLSGTLDQVAPEKELVENVHGVRGTFLDVGAEVGTRLRSAGAGSDPVFGPSANSVYFLGKLLWSKGLGSLMELLKYAEESAELKVPVDIYGGGPDEEAAQRRAESLGLEMPFHGPLDHAELAFTHKIFVNPSTSEVLCTVSAEALAMNKFVILPSHPSNDFFAQFPNCLTYTTPEEFVGNLYYALTHSPQPLTKEYSHALTWDAATERLEAAACIPEREADLTKEAGVEIALPPLVDSEKGRKVLVKGLHSTRERYRQFRTRLSNDIQQSRVLPKQLRDRLVRDLDRRLDFDIDEIVESPKLKLKLSPAELDKQLLEFYNTITQGPSGDLMRVIGGGGRVGLQDFYMKRKAARKSRRKLEAGADLDLLPAFVEEVYTEEKERSATQWVQWALSRNLPRNNRFTPRKNGKNPASQNVDRSTPQMCLRLSSAAPTVPLAGWSGLRAPNTFRQRPTARSTKFSLLI